MDNDQLLEWARQGFDLYATEEGKRLQYALVLATCLQTKALHDLKIPLL
jgi:hypothetical protein